MPRLSEGMVFLGGLAIFAVWLFVGLPLLNRPTYQTPQIQTDQKPEHRVNDQGRTQPQTGRPDTPSAPAFAEIIPQGTEKKGHGEGHHGSEEGTEFWPPLFGYRLKVTDTLIALFTAGLFLATWLLFRVTRALVRGAEDTAKRQLRAYISAAPITTHTDVENGILTIFYEIRNVGQTPAYKLQQAGVIRRMPWPLPGGFSISTPEIATNSSMITIGRDQARQGETPRENMGDIETVPNERLYLVGIISYVDAFDQPQTTKICCAFVNLTEVVQATEEGDPSRHPVVFTYSDQHNDAT